MVKLAKVKKVASGRCLAALALWFLLMSQVALPAVNAFQTTLSQPKTSGRQCSSSHVFATSGYTPIERSIWPGQKHSPKTPMALHASRSSSSNTSSSSSDKQYTFDIEAVFKYAIALGTQMGLFYLLTIGFDKAVAKYSLKVPFLANAAMFYFFSLKSRIFNPLSAERPQMKSLEIKNRKGSDSDEAAELKNRKQPSWTPPGFVFPIVWLGIIGPIRAYTSALIVDAVGAYNNPATLAFFLHLSIGDLWNTVNNVERRNGVSVLFILGVWASKAYVANKYYQINPFAGKLLAGVLIWLTVATTLIARIWRINPDPDTGKPDPLLPMKSKGKPTITRFAWFK